MNVLISLFYQQQKVEIYEQIQTCRFGDFCGNSVKARLDNNVKEKTNCLLNYLYIKRDNFRNHLYKENR